MKKLPTAAEAAPLPLGEIFALAKERLGLDDNASYATVVAAADRYRADAIRGQVCDKLHISRDVDDDTFYDSIYAAITKPTSSTDSAPRDGVSFARNPRLAAMHGQSTPASPAPTLFPGGDLPAATASGHDPRELLQLPACVRHAAAKADQAEWARLMNSYATGDPDDDIGALLDPASADHGNTDYQDRFSAWQRGQ